MKVSKKNISIVKNSLNAESDGILKSNEIRAILERYRGDWKGKIPTKTADLFSFIRENKIAEKVEMNFPNRKETRYITKKVSDYRLLLSLSPESYFSHLTAAYFNDLIQEEPKIVYVNTEQSRKNIYANILEQENIDYAFNNPARISQNYIKLNGKTIYHLNSKYSNCLGVVSDKKKFKHLELRFTDVERTLIDVTVRPQYSGGVKNVLKVFHNAADKINIKKIITYLKKLNYIYPYHQCIGFYLGKVGLDETSLQDFKSIGMEFNFYLCNEIKNPSYSERWKLYYPKSLE